MITTPNDNREITSQSFSYNPATSIWQHDDWKDAEDILEEPMTERWQEDGGAGNVGGVMVDDRRKRRRKRITIALGVMMGITVMMAVTLLKMNARHAKSPAATKKTPSKDIIVVPQAPKGLSKLCSPINIRWEDGFAACEQACEVASCCMEEDEGLNCSTDNAESCSQYSACFFDRDGIPSSACEHSTCVSCLGGMGCVWARGSCHDACPQFEEEENDSEGSILGDFSPCYFINDYPDSPESVCREERDEFVVEEPCEWETTCEDCLRCEIEITDHDTDDITCRWILDASGAGRCQSSCSAAHGCGVDACPPK